MVGCTFLYRFHKRYLQCSDQILSGTNTDTNADTDNNPDTDSDTDTNTDTESKFHKTDNFT